MSKTENSEAVEFAFGKKNYLFMGLGLVLIVLGLVLLAGGGSEDPAEFSEEIFNFQRMTIAPVIMLAGFVLEIYAIMYRPKSID
ncbi:MAG: DUF3098 domain-containing protein [Bacteroidales bacterium]|nr:DUF3098 domain-containing protein [Bacteroidales bacterium]